MENEAEKAEQRVSDLQSDDRTKIRRGLMRFRKFAHRVKGQLKWMKSLSQQATENLQLYVIDSPEPKSDEQETQRGIVFNVDGKTDTTPGILRCVYRYSCLLILLDFRRGVQVRVGLSPVLETILLKQSWERTEQDLEDLTWLMSQLKCFSQYTPYALRELSRILCYEAYEKGRVIIRQGTSLSICLFVCLSVLLKGWCFQCILSTFHR